MRSTSTRGAARPRASRRASSPTPAASPSAFPGPLWAGIRARLFHLLYRFSPEIRTEFGRSEEGRWIERYGFVEHSIGKPDDESMEDGRNSRRKKFRKVVRERPGLAPSALFHLIGNTIFLRLWRTWPRGCRTTPSRYSCPRWTRRRTRRATPSAAPTTPCSRSCARSWPRPSRAAPRGCWRRTCKRCWPTPMGAPRARRSSTPGAATSSCRCRPCPRTGSTPRRRRSSTWWPPSAWRDAGCWST